MTDADTIRLHLLRLGVALSRALLQAGRRDDAVAVQQALVDIDQADEGALLAYGPRLYQTFSTTAAGMPCVGRA